MTLERGVIERRHRDKKAIAIRAIEIARAVGRLVTSRRASTSDRESALDRSSENRRLERAPSR